MRVVLGRRGVGREEDLAAESCADGFRLIMR